MTLLQNIFFVHSIILVLLLYRGCEWNNKIVFLIRSWPIDDKISLSLLMNYKKTFLVIICSFITNPLHLTISHIDGYWKAFLTLFLSFPWHMFNSLIKSLARFSYSLNQNSIQQAIFWEVLLFIYLILYGKTLAKNKKITSAKSLFLVISSQTTTKGKRVKMFGCFYAKFYIRIFVQR